jgi:hypothetical protein
VTDELQVEQLVARYDDDRASYLLTGWLSGPAGSAAVGLAGGRIIVDIDYASPGTISHIEVEAPNTRIADDVARSLAVLTGVPDLAVRLREVDDTARVVHANLPQLDVVGTLGRLALLLAEHDNPRRSDAARAAAALEAANLVGDLDPELRVDQRPEELWREAATALDDATSDAPDELLGQLRLAAARSEAMDAALSRRLARIAARLEPGAVGMVLGLTSPDFAAFPAAPASPERRTAAAAPRFDVTVEVAPDLDVAPATAALDAGVLRVGATGTRSELPNLYLRVFRRASEPVPIALVPFVGTRFDSANATAVVPRVLDGTNLLVEVTDAPDSPFLAPTLRATMRAVRIGRDASRYGRRAELDQASETWMRSADMWRANGDERRANLAAGYARGDRPRSEPLLSDHVE